MCCFRSFWNLPSINHNPMANRAHWQDLGRQGILWVDQIASRSVVTPSLVGQRQVLSVSPSPSRLNRRRLSAGLH